MVYEKISCLGARCVANNSSTEVDVPRSCLLEIPFRIGDYSLLLIIGAEKMVVSEVKADEGCRCK